MKRCSRCKEAKPLKDFPKTKTNKDGLYSWCRICACAAAKAYKAAYPERKRAADAKWRQANREEIKAYLRDYYHANPRKYFANQLMRNYGLTIEQFEAMLAVQSNRCAICHHEFGLKKADNGPCVDHCHATGVIRGLLCSGCNGGIGMLRESTAALQRAIEYLKRFEDGQSAVAA